MRASSRNDVSDLRLEAFLKDVSLLTLGSLGNLTLVHDVGRYVGSVLKSRGYSYYMIGPLDTLSQDDADYFYRVHKSPYIVAEVYEYFATGLGVAGVVAVFDGRGRVDPTLVSALSSRKLTYPVVVEDEGKANLLSALGLRTVFIKFENGEYKFLNGDPVQLFWSIEPFDGTELRRQLLLNSIIYISRGEIQVKRAFARSGVVVYSNEDFVLAEAQRVLQRGSGPGRLPW